MVVIPSQQPVLENLNAYYLNIRKLLEHCQGEIGSGAIHFKSHAAEGVLFFDQDQLLSGFLQEKKNTLAGHEAIERLLEAGKSYNFIVTVFQIDPEEVYYWAGIHTAEKIYKDLSTEFTDLEGLIKKMGSEKLTGYIDISIGSGEQKGLIFLINGKMRGGSCSEGNGMSSPSSDHQKRLVQKTKEQGGTFNVNRVALNNLPADSILTGKGQAPSAETAIVMMEALLEIFETVVRDHARKKTDFQKLLKQNLVANADRFAFLDPFAGEFEYTRQRITFSGHASDRELVQGVCAVVKKMARDLGLFSALLAKLELWSEKYADELVYYDVNLTEIGI
ncbi:MAG: hypothetical protein PVI00_12415 [Desulfobacterales bacterium]|jgi:hypothetical protein